jgi:dienelactone hydrolase
VILAGVLLLSQTFAAQAAAPPQKGAGKRARVEHFVPKGKGPFPAVVMLHGLDGMEEGGKVYRSLCQTLADKGYVAVVVHYFDRTATKKDDLPRLMKQFRASLVESKEQDKAQQAVEATFSAWMDVVKETVADVRKHPRVDPDRVGLVGFSMGGFLANAAAAQPSLKVRCVAGLFGGLPRPLADQAGCMPPALIIHGDRDEVVPVREAESLSALLKTAKRQFDVKVYRGVGHVFVLPSGGIDWMAALDAKQRTLSFLSAHLGQQRTKLAVRER